MTDKKYSVTKSTTERYSIRNKGIWSWANITISEDGDLNIISDYGNYSYAWRSFGDNFKEFLIDICGKCEEYSTGYLYDKLHNRSEADKVDCEKTMLGIKKDFFESYQEKRRDSYFMAQDKKRIYPSISIEARDCFDNLDSIQNEGEMSQDAFCNLLWSGIDCSNVFFGDEYFHYVDIIHTGDRQCEAFCRNIAPVFAEILKEELKLNE